MRLHAFTLLLGMMFGMTGFFQEASADVLVVRQELTGENPGDQVEVTAFLAETEADRQEVVERLQKTFTEDLAKNPELLTHFEEVAEASGRSPSGVSKARGALEKVAGTREVVRRMLPKNISDLLRGKYPAQFLDNSRMIFTIARGTINASVTTWSLMATQHLPFEVALASGILTGTLSGGLQYSNERLQKYLTSSLAEKLVEGKGLKKGVKFVESLFRWYVLEVGFVAVVQVALTAMGHPPTGTIVENIGTNLTTALKTVAAQGTWDIAISRLTNKNLNLAKTVYAKRVIRLKSDLVTLGLSALAVTGMIGQLAGLPFGDTLFLGMGATGAGVLGTVIYNEWRCRKNFAPPRPAKPADKLTEPRSGQSSDDQSSAGFRAFNSELSFA